MIFIINTKINPTLMDARKRAHLTAVNQMANCRFFSSDKIYLYFIIFSDVNVDPSIGLRGVFVSHKLT